LKAQIIIDGSFYCLFYQLSHEEGPSTTAPPFPNLRKGDEKEPAPAESDKKEPEKEKK